VFRTGLPANSKTEITNKPNAAKISQMNDSCLVRTLAPAQSYFCLSMIGSANLLGFFAEDLRSAEGYIMQRNSSAETESNTHSKAPGPHAR